MKFLFNLLTQIFFIFYHVVIDIIKSVWEPIYTTVVKTLIISGLLWCVSHYIPHHLPFIKELTLLDWITIIVVYRLVTIKYDDFDDNDEKEAEELPDIPNYLNDENPDKTPEEIINAPKPPRNVRTQINDPNTSTRE